MMPNSFPPSRAANSVHNGEKTYAATDHMGIDELILNELHHLINNETQNCLFRYSHKRKQHTNQAGGKRTNIWNKSKRCGQHRCQAA